MSERRRRDMSKVLIIGAGGVGGVVAHKCAQAPEVFSTIVLASAALPRCEVIKGQIRQMYGRDIQIARLDASNVAQTAALLRGFQPDVVINAALPYHDLAIMDACLQARVDYLDMASYQSPDAARFEYERQWHYHDRYRDAGIMALLGCGMDPGVTNMFCAYARKKLYDEIHCIDIFDCNAGKHGHPFATDRDPELHIRAITGRGRYWEDGAWHETEALAETVTFDFPEIGPRKAYLLHHEELESLALHIKGLRRIRFWMTFDDEHLEHLRVLNNVGMTSREPVEFQGHSIVPIQFLGALLPDPSSLGATYAGKTSIGCLFDGIKQGKRKRVFIYNVCDHARSYQEVRAHAVSYATGVTAMVGATMMLDNTWRDRGVFNMEQLDPVPFLDALARRGLPWHVKEL
jgi:saccharopine dehydrogenase (NAD+, L-lysine forming)